MEILRSLNRVYTVFLLLESMFTAIHSLAITGIEMGTLRSNISVTSNSGTLTSETSSKQKHEEPPVLEVIENKGVVDQQKHDSNSAGKLHSGSI